MEINHFDSYLTRNHNYRRIIFLMLSKSFVVDNYIKQFIVIKMTSWPNG